MQVPSCHIFFYFEAPTKVSLIMPRQLSFKPIIKTKTSFKNA